MLPCRMDITICPNIRDVKILLTAKGEMATELIRSRLIRHPLSYGQINFLNR